MLECFDRATSSEQRSMSYQNLVFFAALAALLHFADDFLALGLASVFFDPDAGFKSSPFSVISNAGLGNARSCGPIRVTSVAGFILVAFAVFSVDVDKLFCFVVFFKSGFTII